MSFCVRVMPFGVPPPGKNGKLPDGNPNCVAPELGWVTWKTSMPRMRTLP